MFQGLSFFLNPFMVLLFKTKIVHELYRKNRMMFRHTFCFQCVEI